MGGDGTTGRKHLWQVRRSLGWRVRWASVPSNVDPGSASSFSSRDTNVNTLSGHVSSVFYKRLIHARPFIVDPHTSAVGPHG